MQRDSYLQHGIFFLWGDILGKNRAKIGGNRFHGGITDRPDTGTILQNLTFLGIRLP